MYIYFMNHQERAAVVGKYFDTGDFVLSDAYVSVIEAVKFSAYHFGAKAKLTWLNSKDFEKDPKSVSMLKKFDGVIVPGGFGSNGIEGVIRSIKYVRENKIPYLGLCYGMQLAVIEYARNVLGYKDANTAEIDPASKHLIIDIMAEQKKHLANGNYGASMRLGAYPAVLKKGTIAAEAYGTPKVMERHRHRYEVNQPFIAELEEAGLVFSATSPDRHLMEIAELPRQTKSNPDGHPFFLGSQFHPEFHARPLSPHPLFNAFIKASLARKGK